ncbi:heme oxygenase [Rhodobacter aestuarii]|uniref:Heme oxygenase n=1 Tax=Rhodobacter aestuarii TaxID=453582 RepID=A0A1N7NVB3_9RHOB|nr:biliverdin-producing heme oxygenase [Rhodobacter aestuarii]PTV94531.1 heme oxygenase [Rhodobacter aestuarii]SIT02228.1 Heme oxygenase [Rhodobacter aestuarii]
MVDLSRVPEPAHVDHCMTVLKEATSAAHARIEAVSVMRDLTAPEVTHAQYTAVLGRLHAHFARYEPVIHAALAPHLPPQSLAERAALPALEADLADLGLDTATQTPAPPAPCPAHAAGWLYVHEGTGLGGLVILRGLRNSLGDELGTATRYFQRHGKATAMRWRETRALIAGLLPDEDRLALAVSGAEAAFAAMHLRLAPDTAQTRRPR